MEPGITLKEFLLHTVAEEEEVNESIYLGHRREDPGPSQYYPPLFLPATGILPLRKLRPSLDASEKVC